VLPFGTTPAYLLLPRPLSELASRKELTNWLHQIFLSLALPAPAASARGRIHQPLALNAFTKLLCRLYDVGYPSHWLSAIIEDIPADRVVLDGPLPWDDALPIPLPDRRPSRKVKLNLTPYRAELEVAVATALPILPFAVSMPRRFSLPPSNRIVKYKSSVGSAFPFPYPSQLRHTDFFALSPITTSIAIVMAPTVAGVKSTKKLYDWVCFVNQRGEEAPSRDIVLIQGVTYDPRSGIVTWWMDG
jgi:hypothetical protein